VAEVTDLNGVQWSVHRARPKWESWGGYTSSGSTGSILGDLLAPILEPILAIILGFIWYVVEWPFWFIGKLFGVPSKIVIERDGTPVGQERVRGWNKSGQRIREIAQSAAAGTWQPAAHPVDDYRDDWLTRTLMRWSGPLAASIGPGEDAATPNQGEEGGTAGSRRCRLNALEGIGRGWAIDLGEDAIWVIDLNTNALIASAWLAQVTAKPANRDSATPVLVVGVPGLSTPMIIRPHQIQRFKWRDKVAKAREGAWLAMDEDWLALVEKFGLTQYLKVWS